MRIFILLAALCAAVPALAQQPTDQMGPRPSSHRGMITEHFQVPPGYDADLSMHPYTSRIGPCPQAGQGTRCEDSIKPSQYEQ